MVIREYQTKRRGEEKRDLIYQALLRKKKGKSETKLSWTSYGEGKIGIEKCMPEECHTQLPSSKWKEEVQRWWGREKKKIGAKQRWRMRYTRVLVRVSPDQQDFRNETRRISQKFETEEGLRYPAHAIKALLADVRRSQSTCRKTGLRRLVAP